MDNPGVHSSAAVVFVAAPVLAPCVVLALVSTAPASVFPVPDVVAAPVLASYVVLALAPSVSGVFSLQNLQ